MPALAMIVILGGYGLAFQGWTLLKGYNISFREIWAPQWPPAELTTSPNTAGPGGGVKQSQNTGNS